MSTLDEIEAALPGLSARELRQLAVDLDRLFREKQGKHLYEDSHGTLTDADLILSADRAFQEYDRAEKPHGRSQKG